MVVGVSLYNLNEHRLCDSRAHLVPFTRTVGDLWNSGSNWQFSKRVLSQYPLAAVRTVFPTAGKSDAVLVGLREKLRGMLHTASFSEDQARALVLPPRGALEFGEDTSKLSDLSEGRLRRRMALMRTEIQGLHAFEGPKMQALRRMLAAARARGRIIMIVMPVSPAYAVKFVNAGLMADFEAALADALKFAPETLVIRLDLLPALPSNELYSDPVHLNSAGRHLATEAVLASLKAARFPPVIFTSFEFVIFFLVVLAARACIRSFAAEKWFLLVASYVFYMSWSIPCGLLILATSLLDYCVGLGLGRIDNPRQRKLLLICSIVANLGVLAFFKYTNFLLDTTWAGMGLLGVQFERWHYDIILPAGISFFTFQSMTYTIETYRRNLQPSHSLRDFLLFVAFFPQLLAGPINRAADLLPQFARRVRAGLGDMEAGLAQFAVGAVKKCVLSDQIAPSVDLVFSSPGSYDGLTLVLGALGYAIQIYCDFSGYSDMAIGWAGCSGFASENFQMPLLLP